MAKFARSQATAITKSSIPMPSANFPGPVGAETQAA